MRRDPIAPVRGRWFILRAGVGLRVRQGFRGDGGDVPGVDEGLGPIPGRERDQAFDDR
jgi:hypothetical protein